jgi:hypothetical protein
LLQAVRGKKTALIPYSAFRGAYPYTATRYFLGVDIVATTPDKTITKVERCRGYRYQRDYDNGGYRPVSCWHNSDDKNRNRHEDGSHDYDRSYHFLGETLFKVKDDYLVCGLDRNDDPHKRNFFLAKLPKGRKPKTVDAALDALRPQNVPVGSPRQGEWFLVPWKKLSVKPDNMVFNVLDGKKVKLPLITEHGDILLASKNVDNEFNRRWNRHVPTHTIIVGGKVYVRGFLRDVEHGKIRIGDGETWHRVIKNKAAGSWAATGEVD